MVLLQCNPPPTALNLSPFNPVAGLHFGISRGSAVHVLITLVGPIWPPRGGSPSGWLNIHSGLRILQETIKETRHFRSQGTTEEGGWK